MGKKSQLKNLGKALRQRISLSKEDRAKVKDMIKVGKKIRWTSEKIAGQIIERLRQQEHFQKLTSEQQLRAVEIVNDLCSKKAEWKATELIGLAYRIEKRLKKEFPK